VEKSGSNLISATGVFSKKTYGVDTTEGEGGHRRGNVLVWDKVKNERPWTKKYQGYAAKGPRGQGGPKFLHVRFRSWMADSTII